MQTLQVQGTTVEIEGRGPTILMIHGWPDTRRLWDPQVAALAATHRCVRFTLPGFEPGSPRVAPSTEELVALIGQIVDAVSPDAPVILMIHDWGSLYGMQFYAAQPTRVARMVIVDVGDPRGLPRTWNPLQAAMVVGYQWPLALSALLPAALGDPLARLVARVLRFPGDLARVHGAMGYPYVAQWASPIGSLRRLRRFEPTCPVFFAYGRRKPLMFHTLRWVAALEADPRNRVMGFDCGHWVTVETTAAFNAAVGPWLAG